MQDEGLLVGDGDERGQLLHRLAHVDVGIARVVEDPEGPVHAHVDAGRLYEVLVVGVENEPPGLDLLLDRAIAQNHHFSL
jgi:hypothetical protein